MALPLVVLVACARIPQPDADSGTVWGYVTLVPTVGVPSQTSGYGDRRLANVKRVDYTQLKYAVVYAPTSERTDAPLELRIEADGRGDACLEPGFAATSPAAGLRIRNASDAPQIVSLPEQAWVRRLEPGQTASLAGIAPGEVSVYLLGRPESSSALVWVTAGARAEARASGRYTLRGLPPGRHEIRAWHPRMPPGRSVPFEIGEGEVRRVDLEIAIDRGAR